MQIHLLTQETFFLFFVLIYIWGNANSGNKMVVIIWPTAPWKADIWETKSH